jgi:hypothetical protein
MTPTLAARRRNQAKSHAAFALQTRARMRFALLACLVALPLAARAQTPGTGAGTGTTGTGTCTGQITGTVGLAEPKSDGSFVSVSSAFVPTAFGRAECECSKTAGNPDLNLEIRLTKALPLGTTGSVEIWVGNNSCSMYSTRSTTNQTQCQRIFPAVGAPAVDFQDFTTGSNANGLFHFPISADALASPNMGVCDPTQNSKASNEIFVFVITNDPTMPAGTCTLPLTEQNQGPQAPANAGASAGDGAVSVTWSPPAPGSFVPSFFQVLCADDCGNPIKSKPSTPAYSVCNNGVLQRRDMISGSSSTTTGNADGGVSNADLGTASVPLEGESLPTAPAEPNAASPIADCNVDAGAPLGDGGTSAWSDNLGPLASLDPAYLCTGQLSPSSSSARISGLNNFQTYHFVVVGIDQYGNASPSNLVTAKPQPTEDLYRRFRNAGGGAGHCFVAWYYDNSPPAASWIAAHGWARALVRLLLLPLIAFAWFWLHVPPWGKALALTLLLAFALRRRLGAALRRGTPA